MLLFMRTTIVIDDHLLQAAKRRAAERRTSLKAVIEEALRASLIDIPQPETKHKVELPEFGTGGLCAGVDLDDTSCLLELMDARNDFA